MELNTLEKFIIITHHPQKWWFRIQQINLKYGISGAFLLELALKKLIDLENKKVKLNPKTKSIDEAYPLFDELFEKMTASRREHRPKYWIQRFGRRSHKLKWVLLTGLEKKRLIRIRHLKFLWIPFRRSYLIERNTRESLLSKLRESIVYRKEKSDEDIAILGLIEACKMYRILSPDRSKRKQIRKELRSVLKESPVSLIVADTIKQTQMAIAMAVAASSAGAAAAGR